MNWKLARTMDAWLAAALDRNADNEYAHLAAVSPALRAAGEATIEMVGLMRTPAAANDYLALGIAYDGTTSRKQAWVSQPPRI